MSRFAGIRTYRGSCHCGAVRFEADLDLGKGTMQCNCTRCTKSGGWSAVVAPSAFRLLAGDDQLVGYGKLRQISEHQHCRTCGIDTFSRGHLEVLGGAFVSVNVRCLDDVDLEGVPVRYIDGRANTWATLLEKPWAGAFA